MDLMQTVELLGNFGEFVGAIAIIITLVYLAVQIRQTGESTSAATVSAFMQSYSAASSASLSDGAYTEKCPMS